MRPQDRNGRGGSCGPAKEYGLKRRLAWSAAVLTVLALSALMFACGGGNSTPSVPTTGNDAVTITITSSGVSPRTVTISPGTQVTFVNNDSTLHQMSSNPHPEHTD